MNSEHGMRLLLNASYICSGQATGKGNDCMVAVTAPVQGEQGGLDLLNEPIKLVIFLHGKKTGKERGMVFIKKVFRKAKFCRISPNDAAEQVHAGALLTAFAPAFCSCRRIDAKARCLVCAKSGKAAMENEHLGEFVKRFDETRNGYR